MQTQILLSESYEQNKTKYEKGNHIVGISMWEFEWCPKYRYKMFKKWKYKKLIEACIRRAAYRHGIKFISLSVMPDHVHSIANLPKGMQEERALQILKGCSAYYFFKNAEKFRLRYPQGHLWAKNGTIISTGYSDLQTAINYVEKQAEHHGVAFT